jgi:trans-aconitate methyltransferase
MISPEGRWSSSDPSRYVRSGARRFSIPDRCILIVAWQAGPMRERRTVFGDVADVYDDVRPGYPDELVAAALAYAGWSAGGWGGGPAVEVGAGTGKGTEAFVRAGVPVRCVEADARMAAVLRRRFAGAGVTVDVGQFEDWAPPAGGTRLLYCAQAWHWIDEHRRCALAYRALAPGGAVALFAHRYVVADPAVKAAVREAERVYAPEIHQEEPPEVPPQEHWLTGDLAGSGLFTDVRAHEFEYTVRYPTQRWLRLVGTFSPVRLLLTEPRRAAFVGALGEIADANGGAVAVRLDPVLALGRRPA